MAKRPYCEFDTECARNYWLLKIYPPMGNMRSFTLHPWKPQFTPDELWQLGMIFQQFTMVGFNSANYDEPMIRYALTGCGVEALKQLNDVIIPPPGTPPLRRWDVRKHYPQADIPGWDHIDIMEVVPGVRIGLKTYMARMHSPTIQDLPFDPAAILDEATQQITDEYCGNDLRGTRQLREQVQSRLALREKLTDKLNAEFDARRAAGEYIDTGMVDLRSKSDAQMSEAIITAKLGYRPDVPYIPTGYTFQLTPAPWLQFATQQMQDVFELCKQVTFLWSRNDDGEEYYDSDGKKVKTGVNMPDELKKLRIKIGSSVYKFGIGGLHSQESAQTMYADEEHDIEDSDVGSFYPSIAILMRLFNETIMPIYADIYRERMSGKGRIASAKAAYKATPTEALKLAWDEVETLTSGFKIVLNGGYGKLWSKYSFLLDPNAGIAITINGQLSLLMLIERLELGGVSVVSANTDGIICRIPKRLRGYYESTKKWWEQCTGLSLEATPYKSIHMRDVNSYVAVKPDGEAKRKGVFSESGINASMQGVHPDRDIAKDAAVAYLTHGAPLSDTIRACTNIRKFVLSRKVKGAGQWRGHYLGGTVRWYYSTNGEPITYVSNGNKVAGSDGAWPIQQLPDYMPADVDYAKYIEYAEELLRGAGVKYE